MVSINLLLYLFPRRQNNICNVILHYLDNIYEGELYASPVIREPHLQPFPLLLSPQIKFDFKRIPDTGTKII